MSKGKTSKKTGKEIAFYPPYFDEFLEGIEKISEASRKMVEYGRQVTDFKDVIAAREKIDDLQIKPFGDGGSHIVIRGQKHLGKKTKVIIKK